MAKRLTRAEVPVEQTWAVEDIFATTADFEAAMAAVEADLGTVTQYKGRLGEGAGTLLACIKAFEGLTRRMGAVGTYAHLRNSTDGTDVNNQVASGRVAALSAKLAAATSFINSEALSLPDGTLERYLAAEPGLANYRPLIRQMIEKKPHMLSPETERALASLGEVLSAPSMIYRRSKTSDLTFAPVIDGKGEEVPMSFATYEEAFERSADVALRRNSFASFTEGLKKYQNTFAATFATEAKRNQMMGKLRGYANTTDYLLDEQDVPLAVYNNLHDIILTELAPFMRRYAKLRKSVLGLDKLLYCDIEAPLDPDFAPAMSFAEAGKLILAGVSVMGEEYTEVYRRGLSERWVDWADNVGKSTGAFCTSVYGLHPFALVTWTGDARGAFFLAHELGHGVHGMFAMRNQTPLNTRSSRFFIEAPSTINELLVGQKIMRETNDPRMRRWVIMQFLGTYYHNFVRHLIEGELQRRIYRLIDEGQTLTAATLSKIQGEILSEFWQGEVVIDDGAKLTWMRQPHYYSGLYPYTYSGGLTVGTAVAQAIQEEGQPAIDRWLSVLRAGGTKKPLELMQMAGVDMTKPDPIRKAVNFVGSLIEELEKSF